MLIKKQQEPNVMVGISLPKKKKKTKQLPNKLTAEELMNEFIKKQ